MELEKVFPLTQKTIKKNCQDMFLGKKIQFGTILQ